MYNTFIFSDIRHGTGLHSFGGVKHALDFADDQKLDKQLLGKQIDVPCAVV